MNQKLVVIAGAVLILVLGFALAGVAVWNWVLGPTLAASGPVTAIPLALGTATTAPASTDEAALSQIIVFQLDPASTEARFSLYEELRGQPKTVVGATNQVAGELAVDPANLEATQVGVIQVNARALETDSSQRDRMIRNRILSTDNFEYITFTPNSIRGLSGSAQPGDTLTFELAGDLTIRDVTQPVVFIVTATADSLSQLSGLATTTIQRADFGLIIPSVQQVANVGEEVTLELEFVAVAKQG